MRKSKWSSSVYSRENFSNRWTFCSARFFFCLVLFLVFCLYRYWRDRPASVEERLKLVIWLQYIHRELFNKYYSIRRYNENHWDGRNDSWSHCEDCALNYTISSDITNRFYRLFDGLTFTCHRTHHSLLVRVINGQSSLALYTSSTSGHAYQ